MFISSFSHVRLSLDNKRLLTYLLTYLILGVQSDNVSFLTVQREGRSTYMVFLANERKLCGPKHKVHVSLCGTTTLPWSTDCSQAGVPAVWTGTLAQGLHQNILIPPHTQSNAISAILKIMHSNTGSWGVVTECYLSLNPLPHGDANRHTIFKRKN